MKKFLAVLLASSFLAVPIAEARDNHRPDRHVTMEKQVHKSVDRHGVKKKVVVKKKRWSRGERVSASYRRNVVSQRDYGRYRLSRPRHDQRWVRVDDQFLLVNFATGLIVGLAAAR
ncbi:MAG: RcnB family protein [Shinella sp.]|nr:RcnB family protein [Shinella sp.]